MAPARTRVFLLRHGEVEEHWRERIYGALDVPLSSAGEIQAARAARRLAGESLAAVISSGLRRTEFGATCLRLQRGLARTDDPDLRELERGAWAGMRIADLEQREPGAWQGWFAAPASQRPPGGESLADLRDRVAPRLAHWMQLHSGQSLAIVTHGWVIRVLLAEALGLPLEAALRLDVRTGDLCALETGRDLRPVLTGLALDHVAGSQLSE